MAGTCQLGFSGSISRNCDANGVWGAPTGTCSALSCGTKDEGNANWPTASAGQVFVSGTCQAGWTGNPYRACDSNGAWQAISNPCTRAPNSLAVELPLSLCSSLPRFPRLEITCSARNQNNAQWSVTAAGTVATGVCNEGYANAPGGAPQRSCDLGGVWSVDITNACQRALAMGDPLLRGIANAVPAEKSCLGETYSGVVFPTTTAGSVATGQCGSGTHGNPTRKCQLDGTWENIIINPCSCASVSSPLSSITTTAY